MSGEGATELDGTPDGAFGRVRAFRAARGVPDGSVLTSARVHDGLAGDERFEWRAIRDRDLKDIGRVDLHVVTRRAAAAVDEGPPGVKDRARLVGEQSVRSLLPDTVRQRYEDRVGDRG